MLLKINIKLISLFFFILSILLSLSIISFNPDDCIFIAGGVSGPFYISNLFGWLGANIAHFLFISFGFTSYFIALLLLFCSSRNLFGKERTLHWDYFFLGILASILGLSALLGLFPEFLHDYAQILNISQMPGGVIGEFVSFPGLGKMQLFLNTAGSIVLSVILILSGFTILWYYDWHNLAKEFFTSLIYQLKNIDPNETGIIYEVDDKDLSKENKLSDEDKESKKSFVNKVLKREIFSKTAIIDKDKSQSKERRSEGATLLKKIFDKQKDDANTTNLIEENEAHNKPIKKEANSTFESQEFDVDTRSKTVKSIQTNNATQGKYILPSLNLLRASNTADTGADPAEISEKKIILQETLNSFKINADVTESTSGPRVTLFEVITAPGVRVEKISSLTNNIAMDLKAESLRILTPIPGKNSVGIEVPNQKAVAVGVREILQMSVWQNTKMQIPIILGKNISGQPVIMDLAKAPHLLIAGATGSGKSVCMNTIILSLLYKFSHDDLRMIMVDPKVVEFSGYKTLPHLIVPLVTEVKKVTMALRWALNEMERRYKVLAKVGVRNLSSFNSRKKTSNEPLLDDDGKPIPDKLPFIILIIDELADIMMTAKADVETSLARIAQLSRAVGIHTIIATQRPSVNVITGVIKANFPTRIAFQVTSVVDSRTILDSKGAEKLLGRGDMLFRPPGASKLDRIQGAFLPDNDIENVVEYCAGQAPQIFDETVFKNADEDELDESDLMSDELPMTNTSSIKAPTPTSKLSDADEELVQQAIKVIARDRRATTSYIQRAMRIGYNRAATIIEILEKRGLIGPQIGTAPREIFIDPSSDDN